jgi:hypothetical protein
MLLPAIYLQAKTGNGIFKKDSFEVLRKEMGNEFAIMDIISAIRRDWNYKAPAGYAEARKHQLLLQKNISASSGEVPEEMKSRFKSSHSASMKIFVEVLQNRMKK